VKYLYLVDTTSAGFRVIGAPNMKDRARAGQYKIKAISTEKFLVDLHALKLKLFCGGLLLIESCRGSGLCYRIRCTVK